jgi:hypothetical protein
MCDLHLLERRPVLLDSAPKKNMYIQLFFIVSEHVSALKNVTLIGFSYSSPIVAVTHVDVRRTRYIVALLHDAFETKI